MSLEEIIKDLHALENEIQKLEEKYSLLSEYFYKLYQSGKLDHSKDFTKWAGLYEIKLRRERDFREMLPHALESTGFGSDITEEVLELSADEA